MQTCLNLGRISVTLSRDYAIIFKKSNEILIQVQNCRERGGGNRTFVLNLPLDLLQTVRGRHWFHFERTWAILSERLLWRSSVSLWISLWRVRVNSLSTQSPSESVTTALYSTQTAVKGKLVRLCNGLTYRLKGVVKALDPGNAGRDCYDSHHVSQLEWTRLWLLFNPFFTTFLTTIRYYILHSIGVCGT